MTSSNGNIFRVTGPLCGEFTGPGEFPIQRPVTRSFDVFFDLRLNKRLSKQPWCWWFETPSRSLWRHRNDRTIFPLCRNYTNIGILRSYLTSPHFASWRIGLLRNTARWRRYATHESVRMLPPWTSVPLFTSKSFGSRKLRFSSRNHLHFGFNLWRLLQCTSWTSLR